ncbi:protein of unknown function (plasmid) [Cupriavidus taiwanensis]|uniref:Uncharacterized protein n=1 Tax=Cupriavidus taiwanensis TaxID=164546 RepID=A0A375IR23_9BURK|nr:hypothetical protein CBM2629_B40120 [Cupriavidus taiwanensis]SPK76059.1 protein of unknown function [Cupriavidus taiwanensis]
MRSPERSEPAFFRVGILGGDLSRQSDE